MKLNELRKTLGDYQKPLCCDCELAHPKQIRCGLGHPNDRCFCPAQVEFILQQLASCEKEADELVEALQAEIAVLKNDVNTLNDIVRFKTDMGQGEIDSLAVDIEAIKREAYSNGLTDGRREAVKFIGDGCEWDKKLKEWGLEGK